MRKNKYCSFFLFLFFFFKINFLNAYEIKVLVKINDQIITNQDLINESLILKYLYGSKINDYELNNVGLKNLVEENIKIIEIKKNNMLISDTETSKYLKIILKNYKKSLEDFRKKTNDKIYEKHLMKKVQVEISWNKLIMQKFSNLVSINMDEIISLNSNKKIDEKELEDRVLIEKNKKLQSLSESFLNEIKNRTLIKFL